MMVVVGVIVVDIAVVIVEAKGAVMVVVENEPKLNLDEKENQQCHMIISDSSEIII